MNTKRNRPSRLDAIRGRKWVAIVEEHPGIFGHAVPVTVTLQDGWVFASCRNVQTFDTISIAHSYTVRRYVHRLDTMSIAEAHFSQRDEMLSVRLHGEGVFRPVRAFKAASAATSWAKRHMKVEATCNS